MELQKVVLFAINSEMDIPIKYIIGSGIEDLRPFNPKEFAEALFADENKIFSDK